MRYTHSWKDKNSKGRGIVKKVGKDVVRKIGKEEAKKVRRDDGGH